MFSSTVNVIFWVLGLLFLSLAPHGPAGLWAAPSDPRQRDSLGDMDLLFLAGAQSCGGDSDSVLCVGHNRLPQSSQVGVM